jgi:mono/diheme cytochrome c family protein
MKLATALLAPVAVAIVAAAGCRPAQGPPDPEARTWIRNMWTGPAVLPQAEARPAPAGSMAIDAPRILNRRQARTELVNPLAETPETIAEGEALYRTYCALCHGDGGDGDGELAGHYRRMPPLTAPHVLNYPDGFVYAIVREGGRNMPRFGDALSVDERWALVHYLGTLGSTEREPEVGER